MDEPWCLRNQWYVAGTGTEIGPALLARQICGEPLVLYRRADGQIVCLEDRCPHRKYPLSRGEIVGEDIQCGYHGLRFASTGQCTMIPAQSTIPRTLHVRAYPVVERFALVFVWLGDPAKADPSLLPDFHQNDAAGWTAAHGYHHVAAHYLLLMDNLLDLTHLTFVHKTTLSGPGLQENPLQVETSADFVTARRMMVNVDPAPIHRIIRTFPGKIDRSQLIEFFPPTYIRIQLGAVPAGSNEDIRVPHHVVINSLTPESETSTHYFWSIARCQKLDDERISQQLKGANQAAFDEDKAVIEAQQRMIDSDRSGRPLISLEADKASVAMRRIIKRKLEEETRASLAAE